MTNDIKKPYDFRLRKSIIENYIRINFNRFDLKGNECRDVWVRIGADGCELVGNVRAIIVIGVDRI